MNTLKELKAQLNKGSIEQKKKAYISMLSEFSNDDKVISYLVNKLVKLPSKNLFSDVITSSEANILPVMEIYMRRIIECKSDVARRAALDFEAFYDKDTYKSKIPWREGDEDVIKTVILNDSNMYVRQDAFSLFIREFGDSYPTHSMYELVEKCIKKPYDEGGVFLRTVYHYIPFLPYTNTMYEFVYKKVTHVPIDYETDHLVKQFQYHHPKEFLSLIPVIKQVIDNFIKPKSTSFSSKILGKNDVEQDEDNIIMLAHALLDTCDEDKQTLAYIQNIAERLGNDDLYEHVVVKLAYNYNYPIDFVENEIYKVISNTQKKFKVRLFAVEKLKDFYDFRKITPPKNTINRIIMLFNDASKKKKNKIITTFKPKKSAEANPIVIEKITDKQAKVFFDIIADPLNKNEKKILWEEFLNVFHSNNNDIDALVDSLIESQSILPYQKNIIFHIDRKEKDEIEIQIDNSIKQLGIPQDIEVYKKDSDYSLDVVNQLKLYASVLKKYNFNLVEIDMGWDDFVAIIFKNTDKAAFDNFISENIFYESVNYL